MFDNTLDVLKQFEDTQSIPVDLPTDDHGFLDRQCHAPQCSAAFKVHLDDWKEKVKDEQVFCPLCRHETTADEWSTPDQLKHLESLAVAHITGQLHNALAADAAAFSVRTPLINISMSLKPSDPPTLLPISATEVMELRVACEVCGCRYASVGAAFFCPACGHNSARTTFAQMVETVLKTLDLMPTVLGAARASGGLDVATDLERILVEFCLSRLVSSFQRLSEAMFEALPNAETFNVRQNLFQNLDESSDLWFRAVGKRYEDLLEDGELVDLRRLFQQRHLLAHCEGIVDQRYIDRSGDRTYAVGQRVVVKTDAVRRLAALVQQLGGKLALLSPPAA